MTMSDVTLRTFLQREVFGSFAIPADIARLWEAQEADDTELLDAFELVLVPGLDADEILEPFAADGDSDPASVRALGRVLREVIWVGEALDGLMLGYWRPPTNEERRVVISLDIAGQLELQGATFGDALVGLTDPDDPEEAAEVVDALLQLGIEPPGKTAAEVFAEMQGVPEPNEVVLGYVLEERLQG
jgi:hypothetical protein